MTNDVARARTASLRVALVAAAAALLATGAAASVSPPPTTWPAGRPVNGLALYPTDCTSSDCHTGTTNATDRLGKVGNGANNPAKINNAILNGKMTNARLRALTAQQIADIAAYLGNPGAATGTPLASATPASVSFASTAVGATSAAQTVTLANGGTAALGPISFAASGPFVVSAGTCSAGGTVAAGSSCTLAVSFRPAATGPASGTLTISHNATPATTSVSLAGSGAAAAAPIATASPGTLAFAPTLVGARSAAQTVTLANAGNAPLVLGPVAASAGFAVAGGTCSTGVSLAPGASCTVAIAFAPTVAGAASGTLVFTHNANPSSATVALSGTASVPAPSASVTPPALAFSQVTGTVSAPQTVRIANTGSAPLVIGGVAVSGAQAGDFALVSNTCAGSVAAGASCTVNVTFTPAANGTRVASLVVSHNAAGSPASVALNGVGNASPQPVVSVSNNVIDLGTQALGGSATGSVTVTNSGQAPLLLSALTVSGTAAADYALVGTCSAGLSVAVGQSCTLAVRFAPTALGVRPASVALASNAPAVTVGLTGSGAAAAAPAVTLAPSAQNFATVAVGAAPLSRTVTLTNSGNAALNLTAVSVTGAGFAATHNCGSGVAPGASCSIVVAFAPPAASSYAGQLVVTSNAVPGTATVALSGIGSLAAMPVLAWVGSASFADTAVGATSAPVSLTLVNQGPGTSSLTSLDVSSAEFVLGGTCAAGASLAAGSSCSVSLAFAPAGVGPRTATLGVVASGSAPAPLALSGNGLLAAQQMLTVTPQSLSFPVFVAGSQVDPMPVTVSNSGTTPIRVTALRVASGLFVGTARCGATPFALAPGQSCIVDVAPDAASAAVPGDLADTLTVVTDTPGMSHALSVVASVAAPAVEMTNVGAGGCSLVAPASGLRDPTLWLLALAATAVLAVRRRERRRAPRAVGSAPLDPVPSAHPSTGEHR
ncbi:MAG: choice-of-anchor D domain-containing protein [Caldimonas sp.]